MSLPSFRYVGFKGKFGKAFWYCGVRQKFFHILLNVRGVKKEVLLFGLVSLFLFFLKGLNICKLSKGHRKITKMVSHKINIQVHTDVTDCTDTCEIRGKKALNSNVWILQEVELNLPLTWSKMNWMISIQRRQCKKRKIVTQRRHLA